MRHYHIAGGWGLFYFHSMERYSMDTLKGYERITLPFGKPILILKTTQQVLLNNNESIRAVNESGLIIIQTKKLKGNMREVARINTRVTPPTIEFALEEIPQ
jgi:hypothetical protein